MNKRPLSPHLQVYKIQITSFLSILHRATGIALYGGAFLWAFWFIALASGTDSYALYQSLCYSPFGIIILIGWTFSFFYHLCNGIRHLMWDIGSGYEMSQVRFSGWVVVISSLALSCFTCLFGLFWSGLWL